MREFHGLFSGHFVSVTHSAYVYMDQLMRLLQPSGFVCRIRALRLVSGQEAVVCRVGSDAYRTTLQTFPVSV